MKRLSLVLILAILLASLSFSTVFARSIGPFGAPAPGAEDTDQANACWGADLQGQVRFGRLYAGPGFSINRWLEQNPGFTREELFQANPNLFGSGACQVIVLPSR